MAKATILMVALLGLTMTASLASGSLEITSSIAQLNSWLHDNVKPISQRPAGSINATLAAAEASPRVIRVRKNGGGDFNNITAAINSVPSGNKQRVIIMIGYGVYNEKLFIGRDKPFITLLGSPSSMPTIAYDGTAKQYGTVYSATLQVEANFFMMANILIRNTAPRPKGATLSGEQAVAFRIAGDMAAFYNCRFYGFQDTLCDDRGRHFFKDCYIEGTVDFIFGNGKSLYLATELHVISDKGMAFITAQARENKPMDTGFSFVHCSVTGVGSGAFLGRAWRPMPTVIFTYTKMTGVVHPLGWSDNNYPDRDKTVVYGEFQNSGPGANPKSRAKFTRYLSPNDAKQFMSLDYIHASEWLLPPPNV